ncbi:MAG: universal stress protein, partial [Ginsengibacter sp.]
LGKLLVLSQVVLSLQLGFAVIPLIHFASDRKAMKEFTIKLWLKILAWLSAAIIVYLNIQLVIQQIHDWATGAGSNSILVYSIVIPIALGCLALLVYVFVHPFLTKKLGEKKQVPHGLAEPVVTGSSISYKHIAMAIDFSGKDQKIIQNAIWIGGTKATYTFIHIVESAAARYLGKNAHDQETQLDKSNLNEYRHRLQEMGYKSEIQIGFGNPAVEMSKIILSHSVDLLVVGSHGHKGLKDILLGSTVDTLRHKINIPVLVIN